jgi:hypothetical protein
MRAPVFIAALAGWCLVSAAAPLRAQAPTPDGWVVLPVDEYRTLRDRALGVVPPLPPPPVEAALTRVDYELQVDGESIAGRAILTVDVLADGWARVAIPAGLMVRDARVDGRPVPLVEEGAPHLLLSRAGRALVTLELVVPLALAAGTESIALPSSTAPTTRISLVLPRSGVDLTVSGGFIAERVEQPDESRWTLYGLPNEKLALSWKRRVDDRRASLPLRMRARVSQFVGLAEDTCQVTASVRIEIVQGSAQDFTILVPAGLVINQVSGATVADWQAADSTLRVRLLEPVSSEATFVVQAEMRSPRDGAISIPLVRAPDAERESGGVAVDVLGAGEIADRQVRGLEPADPSELGDVVAGRESPSMIGFRLRPMTGADPRGLTVTVVRYTPQAVLVANVEEARYRILAAAEGRMLVKAEYAVRNNQRSFLKLSLPAGATVWSAEVAGRPIRPGLAEEGSVLLPLDKGRVGQDAPTFVVEVVYLQRTGAWTDRGRAAIELPALDLPVSRTGLRLFYPPQFQVALQPGVFRPEQDHGPFAEALRRPVPVATAGSVAARIAPPPPAAAPAAADAASAGLQALVDRFRSESGERTVVGILPVDVNVPDFGPSVFLAAELTAESRAPSFELSVKRARD